MGYRVAVVGATGNVGRELFNILEEVNFPVDRIHAIASRKSIGVEVSFGEKILKCEDIEQFDFSTVDIVLMSAGGAVSKAWSEKIGKAGAIVIDNSSTWRMDPDVPLVIPEVNPDAVEGFGKKNIIANPNCTTMGLLVAIAPLHRVAKIKRIVVSTYQSVSGTGKAAMDELWEQTKGVFVLGAPEPKVYHKQIAFNVIPQCDVFLDDDSGDTKEERKMRDETHKILDPNIRVSTTSVRVPVFVGHGETVNIEFESALDADEAREILREADGVVVIDKREDGGYATPKDVQGEFPVFVSRIRNDPSLEHGLSLWVVSDNLRKGAALNAVQIAQLLHARGLIGKVPA
ncbi:MAG TPA: aspartate-semialdehyde dehydrogenase [Caulobacter sp.]|nr:aspartate-semialdehyde dehydrogenase [Caulobacter sp.]